MARRGKPSRRAIVGSLIAAAVVVAGVAVAVLGFGVGGPSARNYSIRGVMALGDGTLLVIERAGMLDSSYDRGRLRVIDRDGREVRRGDAVEAAIVGHGVVDGHVWVTTSGGGLEAWRLGDLRPVPGAKAALAAHPMVGRTATVQGLTGDAVVVRAADDALYTITPSYEITKQPKDLDYRAVPARSRSVDQYAAFGGGAHVRFAGGVSEAGDTVTHVDLGQADLVRPSAVLEEGGRPLHHDGAALAHSLDFQGLGNSAIVSRVDAPARLRWSRPLRDLFEPGEAHRDAAYRLVFADIHDGALWVVAEGGWMPPSAGDRNRRKRGEYAARIASIDLETGEVRTNARVAR